MGTFRWPLRISSMDGQQAQDVEATVDTGAAYTALPGSLLRELGIQPMDKAVFLLADGRRVEMDIGRAWATVDGSSEVTLVVFGEDDAPALLGAYTLEGLRLAVDPIAQRLVPTHLIMYLGGCGARRAPSACTGPIALPAHTPQCPSHSLPKPSRRPSAPRASSSGATAWAKGIRSMCR